jgi:hypothetical protein
MSPPQGPPSAHAALPFLALSLACACATPGSAEPELLLLEAEVSYLDPDVALSLPVRRVAGDHLW